MSDKTYAEKRREEKHLVAKYRLAASRLAREHLQGRTLGEMAHVHMMEDGAYVDVAIWIPLAEAEKEIV